MKSFKKALALLLSVVMLIGCMAAGTMASASEIEGNYTYTVENGEATITDCDSYELEGEVVIPSELGGYPVTAIADYAFEDCYYVTSFVIPDSVKTTGYNAFAYCGNLKSIDLGDGLTDFPFEVLEDSDDLEEIIIGKSVRIEAEDAYNFFSLYDSYETLTDITVSADNPYLDVVDGVLYGENMTLLLYYPLSSTATVYEMPATVKGVFYPLYLAKNIQKIAYNDKFSLMDDYADGYEIIEYVADLSVEAVEAAQMISYLIPVNVAEITVDANNPYLTAKDNVLYNKDESILIRYAANRADNVFEIPETASWMALEALSGARNLELTISDGFTNNLNAFLKSAGESVGVSEAMEYFLSSSAAKKFIVADTNKYLKADNGILYNKNMTDLIKYPIDSYGDYYELPAAIGVEDLVNDDMDVGISAFASVAGANLSVYPEMITASELTVHVSESSLEAATSEEAYEVIAYAFLGVKQVCTDELTVEMKAYNSMVDELIAEVADMETEYESIEKMLTVMKALSDDLKNESIDNKTALLNYADNAYETGLVTKEEYDEAIAEFESMPQEEIDLMAEMLGAELDDMIVEFEKTINDPEIIYQLDFMNAACVKIAVCGGEHLYEIVWRNAPVSIKTPSVEEINYGETLILHADYTEIPEGAKFVWTVSGEGVEIAPSEDGTTCSVTSVDKGTATVKLTVVDENGKPVKDENGAELGSELEIKSNSNIWLKIVAFFKKLFRIDTVIEQSIIMM